MSDQCFENCNLTKIDKLSRPGPSVRVLCGIAATVALLILSPVAYGQTPIHVYELDGTLADSLSGPALVSAGGTLNATSYSFGPNQGLSLSNGLPNPAD